MRKKTMVFLHGLVFLSFIPLMSACPFPCTCRIDSNHGLTVNCRQKGITSDQLKTIRFPIESKIIDLDINQLTYIREETFSHVKGLIKLHLYNNNIHTIHENAFKNNINMQFLYLPNNKLTTLHENTFTHNTKLKTLYLEYNNLITIHESMFANNIYLEELRLSENKLTTLHENTFANNTYLKELSLDYNKLNKIHEKAFSHNIDLEGLHLNQNKLFKIHENLFVNNTNLQELFLNNNPLRCDCRMQNMFSMSISDLRGKCQSPEKMKGTFLRNLSNKLNCTSREIFNPPKKDAECSSLDADHYECRCKDGYHGNQCEEAKEEKGIASNDKLIIGCTAGGICTLLILMIIILRRRRIVNGNSIKKEDSYYLRPIEPQIQIHVYNEIDDTLAEVKYQNRNIVAPDYENACMGDLAETAVDDLDYQDTTTLPSQYQRLTFYDSLKR